MEKKIPVSEFKNDYPLEIGSSVSVNNVPGPYNKGVLISYIDSKTAIVSVAKAMMPETVALGNQKVFKCTHCGSIDTFRGDAIDLNLECTNCGHKYGFRVYEIQTDVANLELETSEPMEMVSGIVFQDAQEWLKFSLFAIGVGDRLGFLDHDTALRIGQAMDYYLQNQKPNIIPHRQVLN